MPCGGNEACWSGSAGCVSTEHITLTYDITDRPSGADTQTYLFTYRHHGISLIYHIFFQMREQCDEMNVFIFILFFYIFTQRFIPDKLAHLSFTAAASL